MCRELPKWEPLKNSVIFMDGFTGLTPVQYRLAELFLIHAREVLFTVTLDPREPARKESSIQHVLSEPPCGWLPFLGKGAWRFPEGGYGVQRPSGLAFSEQSGSGFHEQNLYRYYGKSWESAPEHIRVYRGRNPAGEAAYVCSQMERLVPPEGNAIQGYGGDHGRSACIQRGSVPAQFDEAGIPYFLDDKKHPGESHRGGALKIRP